MRKILLLLKLIHLEFKGRLTKIKGDASLNDVPIDFVVTWVDGSDEEWIASKNSYDNFHADGDSLERYRNWGLMRYWFRAIEKYAPWCRSIYFVTEGHVPTWLNTSSEKLKIVQHSEFIPKEYLPTFSSIPIELNLHRIQGLSEHFVYLNDDFFLNGNVSKTDFFEFGLPKYYGIAEPIKTWENSPYVHQLFSSISAINNHFNIRKCIESHPERWFNKKYKRQSSFNMTSFLTNYVPGLHESHSHFNLRKSTLKQVWEECGEYCHNSCKNKFRSSLDVQLNLVQWWEIMNGNYIPRGKTDFKDAYFGNLRQELDVIKSAINDESYSIVCLNDTQEISEEDYFFAKKELKRVLEDKYPDSSSFELQY